MKWLTIAMLLPVVVSCASAEPPATLHNADMLLIERAVRQVLMERDVLVTRSTLPRGGSIADVNLNK